MWLLVPESKDPHPRAFDWIGGLLAVAAVTALVYGVIEQPIHGWTDPYVLIGIIGGAVILAAFIAWDLRHPSPFVDLRLFRNPSFTWATLAFVMTGFALFGVMFILTPYIQIVLGNDAQATGIKGLPLIGGLIVGAGMGNVLAARLGRRIGVTFGMLLTAVGLLIFSGAGPESGYGLVASALAVIGVGLGTALPTTLDIILGVLPHEQTGAGTALTRAMQQVAASLGVAILGSILNSVYQNALAAHLAPLPVAARDIAQGSIAGAAAVASQLPPAVGGPLARAADDAYTKGMADVMLVSAPLMVLTAVAIAIFLPSRITTMHVGEVA